MVETLRLAPGVAGEIVAHACDGYPEEVCGLIAGPPADGPVAAGALLYRGRNVAARPRVAYEMDTATLARQIEFEEAGLALAAIYHSHPAGPQTPSPADVAAARYPGAVHIICSFAGSEGKPGPARLRAFRIAGGQFVEVALEKS